MSRHVVVMVTTSYPRFPGDAVGSFMEPIAQGVAARGHEVHVVAPWHPAIVRPNNEAGVHFHFYRYAPAKSLYVFGYAAALRADVRLKATAYAVAPLALASGFMTARNVVKRHHATIVHAHWVIPNGPIASLAARAAAPFVLSLHGSDVYLAERSGIARRAAARAFRGARAITACSGDLLTRAIRLGAPPDRIEVLPYGVDPQRFQPNETARHEVRRALGMANDAPLVFAAGRLVSKKGFEYLVAAVPEIAREHPDLRVVLAGSGDLEPQLRERARIDHTNGWVSFPGMLSQTSVAQYLAAADVVVVPSVRDDAGNVDGLPNMVLEALASGAAVVTTMAGGIGQVAIDHQTAVVVAERNVQALGAAVGALLADEGLRRRLGEAGRRLMMSQHSWQAVAARFEDIYDAVVQGEKTALPLFS